MHPIISIHIGQAGIQIGNACWELYCVEHGVSPDGSLLNNKTPQSDSEFLDVFFLDTGNGKHVPRTIMVDLEPSVIDEIRNNQYRHLFHPHSLLTGKEDAANNFGRGYYTIGTEIIGSVMQELRREVELTDCLQGFFAFRSMGGGTGSGFTSLLSEQLRDEYPHKTTVEFTVYPSPRLSTSVVEPYNTVLTTKSTIENSDCSFLMDNEALYEICTRLIDVDLPSYTTVNRIAAQVISSITSPFRFNGSINVNLAEFQTNLIPYPRVHFPLTTYAPFFSELDAPHDTSTVTSITRDSFKPSNQLVKCDLSQGKYISCCMLYRGLIAPKEVADILHAVKQSTKMQFVKWCPTGFKVGINYQPPMMVPGSGLANNEKMAVCTIANNTSIAECWARIDYKFDLMFAKRAFVHWFLGEGMEESQFLECREEMAALEKDYEDIGKEEPEEQESPATTGPPY